MLLRLKSTVRLILLPQAGARPGEAMPDPAGLVTREQSLHRNRNSSKNDRQLSQRGPVGIWQLAMAAINCREGEWA